MIKNWFLKHFFFQSPWGATLIRSGDLHEAARWFYKKEVTRARFDIVLADLFSIMKIKNIGHHPRSIQRPSCLQSNENRVSRSELSKSCSEFLGNQRFPLQTLLVVRLLDKLFFKMIKYNRFVHEGNIQTLICSILILGRNHSINSSFSQFYAVAATV